LFEHALQGRDWQDASLHADALMRGEFDDVERPLVATMIHTMAEPGALAPFVERLAANPGWRRPFMSTLTWTAENRALPARVMAMLAARGAPPTVEEAGQVVDRFVSDHDYKGARSIWLSLLPRGQTAPAEAVYNGAFANLPAPPPFNWRLNQSDAAEAGFGRADDGASALHVLARQAGSEAIAEEALVLPPGRYRLTLSARAEPGLTGDLFAWRIACAEGQGTTLGEVRQAAGSATWQGLIADFQVPSSGCGAQWLRLYALPRGDFQPAEAWYRGASISGLTV
jgi:hypothetical protein